MKQAGYAAAIALAAMIGGAGGASAQAFGMDGQFYLKGFGGASWPSSFDANLRERGSRTGDRLDFNYDMGYTLGAAVGYTFTPNFALEVEYAYRNADLTGTAKNPPDRERTSGDGSSNSFMFNALYLFPAMGAGGQITPYLGGGIGGANVEMDAFGRNWDANTLLAYQLIGGVGYQVNPNVSLFAEARWFQTQEGEFRGPSKLNYDGDFDTFDLLVGVRYAFGPTM